MHVRVFFTLIVVGLLGSCEAAREKRRALSFRKMSKIFVRYNVKVNVVPYTSIFAYAMGFRANWDVKPPYILNPQSRQSMYPVYHQRALHDAVIGALDWHGLNGNACLIRAMCEAGLNKHDDVISKAFNLMFHSEEGVSCPKSIDCPISLLSLVDNAIS